MELHSTHDQSSKSTHSIDETKNSQNYYKTLYIRLYISWNGSALRHWSGFPPAARIEGILAKKQPSPAVYGMYCSVTYCR